jgi:hypothetical protein
MEMCRSETEFENTKRLLKKPEDPMAFKSIFTESTKDQGLN